MWIVIESQARIVSLTEDSVKTGASRASQAMPLLLTSKMASRKLSNQQVRSGMPVSSYTVLTTLLMHDAI